LLERVEIKKTSKNDLEQICKTLAKAFDLSNEGEAFQQLTQSNALLDESIKLVDKENGDIYGLLIFCEYPIKVGTPILFENSQIANYLDMDVEKVTQIMSEDVVVTSIYDKKGNSEDSMEIIDTIEDTNKLTPHEQMEEKNVKSDLQKALQRLPERERTLMVLYYQENMTMKEIGETMGMSESRVCQLHAQAIMKLKNILNENRTTRLQQAIV
jgi:RNA polymerase sigma factor (sigma-70 family)